jgi:lipopolysaccharide export system protein LptC
MEVPVQSLYEVEPVSSVVLYAGHVTQRASTSSIAFTPPELVLYRPASDNQHTSLDSHTLTKEAQHVICTATLAIELLVEVCHLQMI